MIRGYVEHNSTKQWTRLQIMEGLKKIIPEMNFMRKSEDFDGKKDGIWTSGEHVWIYKGLPPFNHNLEYGELVLSYTGMKDPKFKEMKVKTMYVNGVHKEIHTWLAERGWYPKWYDAGTLFFWSYNIEGFRV